MDPELAYFLPPFMALTTWYRPLLYGLISVIAVNVMTISNLDRTSDNIQATYYDRRDTFEFIVVGGGSAGAVVANRLSEDFSVLLLEAGGEPTPISSVPILSILMLGQPNVDWQYQTTPQTSGCFAMKNRKCAWPRGKGLGGSSNLNFLVYLRGHRKDFDHWAEVTGDQRWSYQNVLSFFKKSEDFAYKGEWTEELRRVHATGGLLHVEEPPYSGLAKTFLEAGAELGYPEVDLNGNFTEGFETQYYTQKNGRRFGTFKAFIEPARSRPNLTIYKYAHVNRVILDADNKAVGVEYERHGKQLIATATKEVILSAGAVNSPKILMLSGIGPKEHLESFGIPVKTDLPVGQNLQDHVTSFVGPFIVNQSLTFNLDRDLNPEAFYNYANYGTGPLTSTGVQASAFFVSQEARKAGESDWPDTQFMLLGTAIWNNAPADFQHAFNVRDGILQKYYESARNKDSFMIITVLARPKGRGEVRLAGIDPTLPPLMNPNYLQNDTDVRVLVEGMQRAVKLVETTQAFQVMDGQLTQTPFPGCEGHVHKSNAYFECYLRHLSLTMYHPTATCRMGRADDSEAVLDPELRVRGVKGLRVIDASVMPTIVSSNPNAAIIMIGERGADLVNSAWSKVNVNEIKK